MNDRNTAYVAIRVDNDAASLKQQNNLANRGVQLTIRVDNDAASLKRGSEVLRGLLRAPSASTTTRHH